MKRLDRRLESSSSAWNRSALNLKNLERNGGGMEGRGRFKL
jgi:hypothetical protein